MKTGILLIQRFIKKKNTKLNQIKNTDISFLIDYLLGKNNKTLYLIIILSIILGLSLRLICKIKKKNILLNSMTLNIYENKNRIRRNLSGIIGKYIISYDFFFSIIIILVIFLKEKILLKYLFLIH